MSNYFYSVMYRCEWCAESLCSAEVDLMSVECVDPEMPPELGYIYEVCELCFCQGM